MNYDEEQALKDFQVKIEQLFGQPRLLADLLMFIASELVQISDQLAERDP